MSLERGQARQESPVGPHIEVVTHWLGQLVSEGQVVGYDSPPPDEEGGLARLTRPLAHV